jgi:hypothetical protein
MPTEVMPGVTSEAHGVLKRLAGRDHFPAVIMAAMATDVMGTFQLAAVVALGVRLQRQRLMAAPHPRA